MTTATRSYALAIALALSGCSPTSHRESTLSSDDYKRYVSKQGSGLSTVIESGVWIYRIQYRPPGYIALTENPEADSAAVAKRCEALKQTVWFNVSIAVKEAGQDPLKYQASTTEYNTRLAYFLNEAQQNFRLNYGDRGEMTQVGYHFENYYNLKPEVVAVIGFEIPDNIPEQDMELSYADELFNSGIIKFKVHADQLAAMPRLAI